MSSSTQGLKALWLRYRFVTPSVVTSIRIVSPAFLIPLFFDHPPIYFFGVIIVLALTDWVDGFIADRWDCKSAFGATLDIVADKVFCATLIGFGFVLWGTDWWVTVPYVSLTTYHILVLALRFSGVLTFKSSIVAKTKMFVEMTGLIAMFGSAAIPPLALLGDTLGLTCIWIASGLGVWSMLHYCGVLPDMLVHGLMPKRAR